MMCFMAERSGVCNLPCHYRVLKLQSLKAEKITHIPELRNPMVQSPIRLNYFRFDLLLDQSCWSPSRNSFSVQTAVASGFFNVKNFLQGHYQGALIENEYSCSESGDFFTVMFFVGFSSFYFCALIAQFLCPPLCPHSLDLSNEVFFWLL